MAELAPKLEWASIVPGDWVAHAGPAKLIVSEERGGFSWGMNGRRAAACPTLRAAQLAAEEAALAWLREGVALLGERVLTAEQVRAVVAALGSDADDYALLGADDRAYGEKLRQLADDIEARGRGHG